MNYDSYFNIPYTNNNYSNGSDASRRLQTLDLYLPSLPPAFPSSSSSSPPRSSYGYDYSFRSGSPQRYRPPPPLIVFVHGGAWRSGDKSEVRDTLVPELINRAGNSGLPLAVVNYRLSPNVRHPAHAVDLVAALTFLTGPTLELERRQDRWDRSRVVLVGHSCGAFMCASVALQPPAIAPFIVPEQVRDAVRAVICIDGIYDLPALVDEYPAYYSFVSGAFGEDAPGADGRWDANGPYASASVSNWILPSVRTSPGGRPRPPVGFLILHSRDDELLTLRQPEIFASNLARVILPDNETWRRSSTSNSSGQPPLRSVLGPRGAMEVDFESLRGTHFDLLHTSRLPERVANWVRDFFGL